MADETSTVARQGRLPLTDKEVADFAIRADDIDGRDYVFLQSDVERIITQRVREAGSGAASGKVDRGAAVEAVLAEMGGHIERASNRVYEWPEDEADLHRNGDHRSFTERSAAVARLRAEKIVDAVLGCAASGLSGVLDAEMVERVAAALRMSRLSWGLHADRWGDQEWQTAFWGEAAQIALVTAAQPSTEVHADDPSEASAETSGGDEGTVIAATGNGMKSHDRYDSFLEVSGGSGNHADGVEVHVRIRGNDGHNEGQAWFPAADVIAAVHRAAPRA